MERHPKMAHTLDERLDDRNLQLPQALRSESSSGNTRASERKLSQIEVGRNISQWLTSPSLPTPLTDTTHARRTTAIRKARHRSGRL